jgi:hypothetical protein
MSIQNQSVPGVNNFNAPAPVAKPSPVVSTATAANHIATTVVPTMKAAQTQLSTPPVTQPTTPTTPATGTSTTTTKPTSTTAENTIANTPDTGNTYAYDSNGQRVEVPIGATLPTGYTSTAPAAKPIAGQPLPSSINPTASVTLSNGDQVVQLPDGTYGTIDTNNNYTGTTSAAVFQNAQAGDTALKALQSALSGNTALRPDQQAQIAGVQAQYAQQIQQQTTANNNLQGGITSMELMGGSFNSTAGQSQLSQAITEGAQKIAYLNSQLASTVGQMTEAFNKDNVADLTQSYNLYTDQQKQVQTTIDNMSAALQSAQYQSTIDNGIGQEILNGVTDPAKIIGDLAKKGVNVSADDISKAMANLTPQAKAISDLQATAAANGAPADVIAKIANARTLGDAYNAAGNYGAGGTGTVGEYNYAKANGYTGSLTDFINDTSFAKAAGTQNGKSGTASVGSGTGAINVAKSLGLTDPTQSLSAVVSQYGMDKLVDGIIQNEGGSVAGVQNNPGNIKYNTKNPQHGATMGPSAGADGGNYANFDTAADGRAAISSIITNVLSGNSTVYGNNPTFQDFMNKYTNTAPLTQYAPDPSITDPNTPDPNIGGLTHSALDVAANNYINTQSLPAGLSRGTDPNSVKQRLAILNRAGQLAQGNASKEQSVFSANKAALVPLTTITNATEASANTATENLDNALSLAPDVTQSDSKFLNKIFNAAEGNFANVPNLTAFQTAIFTAANEYAKVTSGASASTAGITDSAIKEAQTLLNAAQTPDQFKAAVAQMKTVMGNQVKSLKDQVTLLSNQQDTLTGPTQQVIDNDQAAQTALQTAASQNPQLSQTIYSLSNSVNPVTGSTWTPSDAYQYLQATGQIK